MCGKRNVPVENCQLTAKARTVLQLNGIRTDAINVHSNIELRTWNEDPAQPAEQSKMDNQEGIKHRNFRIDGHGYDTDNPGAREERVDVSPAGTEGIFIDMELPECDGEE